MDINTLRIGQITVLELRGRIDTSNRDQLLDVVDQELEQTSHTLILNLSDVTYMSISALRVLRRIQEKRGEVYVTEPSKRVIEMLELAGLHEHYRVFESPADAIHSFTPVVNAHTHLELGWLDAYRPGIAGAEFADWLWNRVGTSLATSGSKRQSYSRRAAEEGVEALLDAGTTTVCDITATGESIAPLMLSGLRGVVYIEILGLTPEAAEESLLQAKALIDYWRPKERNHMRVGVSLHATYTLIPELWQKGLAYVRQEGLPLCIHAAESPAEYAFFMEDSGPMKTYLKARIASPRKSPVHYLEDTGVLDLQPLLVHAVQVDDADIQRIKNSGCVVVHCPRSNLRLRCGRMPLEKYLAAGVPVYLGTDSLGSSPSLSIFDELETAVALHYGLVPPEQIEALIHQPFAPEGR